MTTKINKKLFFDALRPTLFKGKYTQEQVEGLDFLLDGLIGEFTISQVAYILATIYVETWFTMQPIREKGLGKLRSYGLKWLSTGQAYYGRGYVMLTHHENYVRIGKELGIDLENNPDLALDRDIALRITIQGFKKGLFTGVGIYRFVNAKKIDYLNARKIINGTDRAGEIAQYAYQFKKALTDATTL